MQEVKEFEFGSSTQRRYEFSKCADGGIYRAEAGVDFDSLDSFRSCLYGFAKRQGLKVRSEAIEGGDALIFQFQGGESHGSRSASGSPTSPKGGRKACVGTKTD